MQIEKEIERAVRRQAALDHEETKTNAELNNIIENIKKSFAEKTYNFGNFSTIILNQSGKKRLAKVYSEPYSPENILCQCVKQILDRAFKVKYPNRNKSIKALFGILSAIKNMSDFTIVKFDFKDYFNSVSTEYVFEKFLQLKLLDRIESDFIKIFTSNTKYTYAGLCTSNIIAEIVAKSFDDEVRQVFISKGILFFERYIDDCILILNNPIEQNEIKDILEKILTKIFHDKEINTTKKCKTRFNNSKFQYVSKRTIGNITTSIDYLGYEFFFTAKNDKINIEYGITMAKQDKYNRRIDELLMCYTNNKHADFENLELLRHRILAFTTRTVYVTKRFRSNLWKVKGFISNYGELRYILESDLIHCDTNLFLKNMVQDAFKRANTHVPYFLTGNQDNGYSLFYNMKVNKTLLFINHIGYDYKSLAQLCSKIGLSSTTSTGKRRGYGNLVRDYLIKTKVGY